MSKQQTRVDTFFTRLKNNRIVAVIIIAGLIVIAVSSFTNATQRLFQQVGGFFSKSIPSYSLRSEPTELSAVEAKGLLIRYGFYESNWNPDGKGIVHQYEAQLREKAVVVFDASTNLMWQQGGSKKQMQFDDAQQYVNQLNNERFAGFTDWRLPTVDEAVSLLKPESESGVNIGSEFDKNFNSVWTADKTANKKIWLVYFYGGELDVEATTYNTWVRVVRSTK